MKNTLLLLMLIGTTSVTVCAQTKSAKAPARSAAPKTAAAPLKPTTAKRANSAALPQTTTPAAPAPVQNTVVQRPAPAPAAQRYTASRPARQSSSRSSGGLGYQKGDNLLSLGVGLSSYYDGTPVGIAYESGISDDISVGAQLDYVSGNYDSYYSGYYYSSREGYSSTYFGVRGSYHVNRLLNLNSSRVDLYAGIGLGYQRFKWSDDSYRYRTSYSYNSGLFFNYFIGGKYYFSDKIGAFIELGYTGLSSSRIGLAAKF